MSIELSVGLTRIDTEAISCFDFLEHYLTLIVPYELI